MNLPLRKTGSKATGTTKDHPLLDSAFRNLHSAFRILASTLLIPCFIMVGACEQKQTGALIGAEEGTPSQLPALKVDLPPSPSFNKEHAPETYTDGSFSVFGIRKNLTEKLNQPIRLRGVILEVYQCPEAVAKSKDQNCLKPHLWLADRANTPKDKAMMVVDLPEKDPETNKKLKFETGAIYTFSGTFSKTSATGFNSSDGLLVFGTLKMDTPEG